MTAKVQGSSDSRSTQNNFEMSVPLDKAAVKSMKALGVTPQQVKDAVRVKIKEAQAGGKQFIGNAIEISIRVGSKNISMMVFIDVKKDLANQVTSAVIVDLNQIPASAPAPQSTTAKSSPITVEEFMTQAPNMSPKELSKSIEGVDNGTEKKDLAETSANGYSPTFFTRVQEKLSNLDNANLKSGILQVIRDCPTIGNPPVINMTELKKGLKNLENKKAPMVAASQIILPPKPTERKTAPIPTTPQNTLPPATIQEAKPTTDIPASAQDNWKNSGKKKEEVSQNHRGSFDFSKLNISKESTERMKDDMQAINKQTQDVLKTAGQANRTQASRVGEDDDGILGSGSSASLPPPLLGQNPPAAASPQTNSEDAKTPPFLKKIQDFFKRIKLPKA